jgi:cytochrome c oxidase assembly factor CtaG
MEGDEMKQRTPAVKTRDGGDFWTTWLSVVVVALSVFGVALALLNATPLFDPFHRDESQLDSTIGGY